MNRQLKTISRNTKAIPEDLNCVIPEDVGFDFEPLNFNIKTHAIYDKLKISLFTLNDWTKRGMIQSYIIGGRVLYKVGEIEKSLHQVRTVKY